jgi:RNA polymerase sigma-B factor
MKSTTGAVFSQEDRCTTLELLRAYRQCPSERLRDRLVRLNLGLVKKEVNYWCQSHADNYEDVLQVGLIGLMGAIDRFELDRGFAFSSFAVRYIRGEIQHYLRDRCSAVRVPRRWLELRQQGMKVAQQLRMQLHREPTEQELIKAMGITLQDWQEAKLAYQNTAPVSLDAPVAVGEDSAVPLFECLADPRSSRTGHSDEMIQLHQALARLEQRTRAMVECVFLEDLTQRQVAQLFGVSTVTVSRQVKRAVESLRVAMSLAS